MLPRAAAAQEKTRGKVEVTRKLEYYDVRGRNSAELRAAMDAKGPLNKARGKRYDPRTDWALGWDTPTPGQSSSGTQFSDTSIGHLGFTGTSVWIDLEKEAIVVMLTNRVHLIAKKSRFELRPIVHDFVMDAFAAG